MPTLYDPEASETIKAQAARIAELEAALRLTDEFLTKLQTPGSEPLNSINASRHKSSRSYWTAQLRNQAREVWAKSGNVLYAPEILRAALAKGDPK